MTMREAISRLGDVADAAEQIDTSFPPRWCEHVERQRNHDGHGGTAYQRCGYPLTANGSCPLGHPQEGS